MIKLINNIIIGILSIITNAFAVLTLDTSMNFYFSVPAIDTITPEIEKPWLILNFTQIDSYTLLTITSNLTDDEYISSIGLNLNPDIVNYDSIIFENISKVGIYNEPNITVGNNIYNTIGGNIHDIKIAFSDIKNFRFDNKDVIILKVENSNIDMFRDDEFKMIARIQGIGEYSRSTWMTTIPESNSMLLIIGSVGIIILLRKR